MMRICVYCGSSFGRKNGYIEAARAFGAELARRGHGLVYGGGRAGLMGEVANAALSGGAEVFGVIPKFLVDKELAHRGVTDLRIVDTMHQRKALMLELSDAFACLPGGFGTLEELIEVLSWAQIGLHRKPCVLLDVNGYFQPLLAAFDAMTAEGFVRPESRALALVAEGVAAAIDAVENHRPAAYDRWRAPS